VEEVKMSSQNEMKLIFDARSVNESFARVAVAAFIAELNPTLDEIADIKTAVSEAVTNAIIHGYHEVELLCQICGDEVSITVSDTGAGIADVSKAMEPFYTTKPELERSGMGFSFMEAFMDRLEVVSEPGKGTSVHMVRRLGNQEG